MVACTYFLFILRLALLLAHSIISCGSIFVLVTLSMLWWFALHFLWLDISMELWFCSGSIYTEASWLLTFYTQWHFDFIVVSWHSGIVNFLALFLLNYGIVRLCNGIVITQQWNRYTQSCIGTIYYDIILLWLEWNYNMACMNVMLCVSMVLIHIWNTHYIYHGSQIYGSFHIACIYMFIFTCLTYVTLRLAFYISLDLSMIPIKVIKWFV